MDKPRPPPPLEQKNPQKKQIFLDGFPKWSFSSQSSRHHNSQNVRAGKLKLFENVHPPTCVTCHISGVTCHVESLKCHLPDFFLLKKSQIGWASWYAEGMLSTRPTPSSFLCIWPTNYRTQVHFSSKPKKIVWSKLMKTLSIFSSSVFPKEIMFLK